MELSKSQSRTQTWKQSCLRNILTDYGMPDVLPKNTQNSTKKPKKLQPKKGRDAAFNDGYDDDKQRAKREQNLQRYEDVQKMKALYYKVYLDKLKDKVEVQREQIRKKSEEKESKLKAQEEKEKRESHHVKRRLQRHMLDHDDDFVRRVPKSDSYKIVALQDKLKSEGMLKTQEDSDRFWNDVKDPAVLRKYLFIYKPLPTESSIASSQHLGSISTGSQSDIGPQHRNRTSSVTSHPVQEPKPVPAPEQTNVEFRPLTRIQESRESSLPVTRENTANITTSRMHENTEKRRSIEPHIVAKMAATELERRYPAMELPPMACFTMNLGDNPQDPEEIIAGLSAERRQKERRLFIKRLRRMYHLSSSNRATAQRIINRYDEDSMDVQLDNPKIGDVIAIDEITRDIDKTLSMVTAPSPPPVVSRPWSHYVEIGRRKSILPIQEEQSEMSSSDSNISVKTQQNLPELVDNKREPPRQSPSVPLSLDTMQAKMVEAKCMSTLWTNYLNAGQSKYAPVQT